MAAAVKSGKKVPHILYGLKVERGIFVKSQAWEVETVSSMPV